MNRTYTMSYNTIRNVIIVTYKGSSYDNQYFNHYDWIFPVYDCSLVELQTKISNIKLQHPNVNIIYK